jgi:hypothetical protein
MVLEWNLIKSVQLSGLFPLCALHCSLPAPCVQVHQRAYSSAIKDSSRWQAQHLPPPFKSAWRPRLQWFIRAKVLISPQIQAGLSYPSRTVPLEYWCGEWIMRSLWELEISTAVLSDIQAEFGKAPAAEESENAKCSTAAFPKLFTFREVESRFLLLQCHAPP